ncbi:MAG: hypothetical protein JSV71_04410 [Nitrospiraceae bacterium]|nr:MAG: hypothetical protein JSV71_04410 [Nitrospiraceae bacterium]
MFIRTVSLGRSLISIVTAITLALTLWGVVDHHQRNKKLLKPARSRGRTP